MCSDVLLQKTALVGELTTTSCLVIRQEYCRRESLPDAPEYFEDWSRIFFFCLLDWADFRLIRTAVNKQWMTLCWILLPVTPFNCAHSESINKRSYGNHYIPSLWKDFFMFILHTLTAKFRHSALKSSPSLSWPDAANSQPLSPPYYPKCAQRLPFRSLERCLIIN